ERVSTESLDLLLKSTDDICVKCRNQHRVTILINHLPFSIRRKTRHIRDVRYRTAPVDPAFLIDIGYLPTKVINLPIDRQGGKNLVVAQNIRKHALYTTGNTRTITAAYRQPHSTVC